MPKTLPCFAMLLVSSSSSYAQWERVVVSSTNEGGFASNVVHGSPHPLQYYLTPSTERDPSNSSLCIGCPVATVNGRKTTLQDYAVESSQRVLGESFGRKVIEVVLSFRMGPELMKINAEEAARENGHAGVVYSYPDSYYTPVARWKSIIMESSANQYQELYLLINTWDLDQPLSKASMFTAGGAQILATVDYLPGNGAFCEDSYWAVGQDGPRLIDFSAVDNEIKRLTPPGALCRESRCWALFMEKLEVRAVIQEKDAPCTRCDLGTAVVCFRMEGHRAIPVESHFEPEGPPQRK